MRLRTIKWTDRILLALAVSLLTSCAALQQQDSADSEAEPAATTTPAQPSTRVVARSSDGTTVEQEITEATRVNPDNGINRDGQVIQLGRFSEEPPEVEPPQNNVVELNYEQADLRQVLQELGDALQINMVIDPSIQSQISMRTSPDNPLGYEDLWPLMRTLARNAGVTIERAGNVYEFSVDESTVPVEIVMPQWLDESEAAHVLQVTPLTYISVAAAMEILRPMLRPDGATIRLGPTNVIGISGTPGQLSRVNALLDVIDTDPFQNQGIRLYQLMSSRAANVAEELQNVLNLIGGENSSYEVLALEGINALLVTAPASRGFDEINRWVQVLDEENQAQEEQLFIYRVRNLTAETLATTLTEVFEREEDVIIQQADDEDDLRADLPGSPSRMDVESPVETQEEEEGEDNAQTEEAPGSPADEPGGQNQSGISGAVSANLTVTIVADEDTNALLIRATPREYQQLLTTINNLDSSPPQVLINAVIAQATLTDSSEFGVDWTRVSSNAGSGPGVVSTRFLDSGLIGEDGARGTGLIFTRRFFDGSAIIDATLHAIAQDNEVNLLARPSILVANNQEGNIKVGQSVPISGGLTVLSNDVTQENISYRDVGIELTITPHINEDGFINLEIFQSLSSIEENARGINDNPIFSNQEITTRAVVSDQETIILGGLIQDDQQNGNIGVPLLREIPLFGLLFSRETASSIRRELFVILRPQILAPDATTAMQEEFRERFESVSVLLEEAGL